MDLTERNGLAVYRRGCGPEVLVPPYPHASTHRPMAEDRLADLLVGAGFAVVSFDPPGAYRSSRPMRGDMAEMLECCVEAVEVAGIRPPVRVVGHSMSSLCALGLAIERPGLATYRRLDNLVERASVVDPALAETSAVERGDQRRPQPARAIWLQTVRKVDYRRRLAEVRAPTLVVVGRHDPQTPMPCAQELVAGIAGSRLAVLERSGHAPFVEEPETFTREVTAFLRRPTSP